VQGRAARSDPATRRALIAEAAETLLVERDPLLVTFEEVAAAAAVSRPLVHAYVGDRRGLIDAVQVRILGRLHTWVDHGLGRARTRPERLRAIVSGTFAFVEAEIDAWGVIGATGGFDHPACHGIRRRWAATLSPEDDPAHLGAEAAVAALLGGVGAWVHRGVDPDDVIHLLAGLLA